MSSFTVNIDDAPVRALLQRLAGMETEMRPLLQALGDGIVERAKRRFESSTGPDGVQWEANKQATLDQLSARLGKSYRKKDGALNARGDRRLVAKKPLIDTGTLRRQIVATASGSSATVTVTPVYAAIHQFGGQAGRGLKVKIPARPYMPVRKDGALYPAEQAEILAAIDDFIQERILGE